MKIGRKRDMKPPTIEEAKLYAAKIGLPDSEAEAWMDHFESNGWKVGRSPMVSWQASVRTWKRNYEKWYGNNRNTNRATTNNIRNDGVCSTSDSYADAAARKLSRQNAAGQRTIQTNVAPPTQPGSSPP